jgi:transposase-like protein
MLMIKQPTLNGSIASRQYKLYDWLNIKDKNVELIAEKYQDPLEMPKLNNKVSKDYDNGYSSVNPVCPKCNSKKFIKYGFNEKIIHDKEIKPFKVRLQRYKCRKCGVFYQTRLNINLKQGSTYNEEIKKNPALINSLQHVSLRNIARIIELEWNKMPSPQSIKNWLTKTIKNEKITTQTLFSGYYNYDEQYVKINGKWQYRLALFDVKNDILVQEKIVKQLNPNEVESFLKEIKAKIPIIAITTDSKPYYRNIMDKLWIKHQLCTFHVKKELNTWIKKYTRKNKHNTDEINQITNYKNQIFEIIDSSNHNTAKNLFNKLKNEINNIPASFRKIITKKFIAHFDRFVNYMKDQNINKTSNKIENYFRTTLPKAIKRIFKTKQGLQEYLTLQKEKWDKTHKIIKNN